MKVRLSTARTTNKVVRPVSRVKYRTAEVCVQRRKGSRENARQAAWNNWLIEENYF
jgi:hypothetical protein